MRIGVVGDTHNRMTNVAKIVALFREARVTRVVHTGDITEARVLATFAELDVPLVGVFGNNDRHTRSELRTDAKRYGMDLVDPPRTLDWGGRQILVAHDPEEVPTALPGEVDLVLHGHTHRHRHEVIDRTLFFNPGECAGMLEGRNAVGLVDLADLTPTLLRF